ncbi:MAG: hypothetical protein E7172_03855 [Firmicutes bacterium]|nr:hypothetical protein [Bacillota bacterium]
MESKDIIKQLIPGVIVGLILGFGLTYLVGVNETDAIPNYIGGAMCCFIPTLLNCTIVLKGTAKHLNLDLPIKKAFLKSLPYAAIAILIGLFVVIILVEKVFMMDTREISVIATATYEALLGVVVSTIAAFIALKKLEKRVLCQVVLVTSKTNDK